MLTKKPTKGAKAGKKNRKYGRHVSRSPAMKRYRSEKRSEKNKEKRSIKHFKKHPNDNMIFGPVDYTPKKKKCSNICLHNFCYEIRLIERAKKSKNRTY